MLSAVARSSNSVAGKTVLITGAARGIGAETARRLAERGARVSLVGLEPDLLQEVAASCGEDAAWFEADVTDREAMDRAVAGTVERFGGIDVAIANAGIGAGGTVRTMPDEAWERVIQINLIGTYRTIRACLPRLIDRQGHMLVMASVAALVPDSPGMSAYSASKAGAEALAGSLRVEVGHLGVTVGVAYFPWVDTDMVRGADNESPAFRELRKSLKGPIAKTQPLPVAVAAIVKGVERRAERVAAPGWVRGLIPMRGVVSRMAVRDARKSAPDIVRAGEAASEAVGSSAYAPAGAGGKAAERSGELTGVSK
jgi:NAD(P)-dependent dehydrogenase (short-subunit alcohol dehydrogenase family)